MASIKELIEDLTIGGRVLLELDTGREVQGKLLEIDEENEKVRVERDTGSKPNVKASAIIYWEDLTGYAEETDTASPTEQNPVVDSETDKSIKEEVSNALIEEPTAYYSPAEIEKLYYKVVMEYRAKIEHLDIKLVPPDFSSVPVQFEGDVQFNKEWQRLKQSYSNAVKQGDLRSKYRINDFSQKINIVLGKFPDAIELKEFLAYFYSLDNNTKEALKILDGVLQQGAGLNAYHNAVAISYTKGMLGEVLYYGEHCFENYSISEHEELWLTLVKTIRETKNYNTLHKLSSGLSDEESDKLFESMVYLLDCDKGKERITKILNETYGYEAKERAKKMLGFFDANIAEIYLQVQTSLAKQKQTVVYDVNEEHRGVLKVYNKTKGIGFIKNRNQGGKEEWFFHISAVTDEELRVIMEGSSTQEAVAGIDVEYRIGMGKKGEPVAIDIRKIRTHAAILAIAKQYAQKGDYNVARRYLKEILDEAPQHEEALKFEELWKGYLTISSLPKGDGSYAKAKRAEIADSQLDVAESLYKEAISQLDNYEAAVKDLAMLYNRTEQYDDAIALSKEHLGNPKYSNKKSLQQVLIQSYEKGQNYKEQIKLLKKLYDQTGKVKEKEQLLWRIGNAWFKAEKFAEAELSFRKILTTDPNHLLSKQNIAYALVMQEKYNEAEQLLSEILEVSFSDKVVELLQIIKSAKNDDNAGHVAQRFAAQITNTSLSSGIVSDFIYFHLKDIDISKSIKDSDRVKDGKYIGEGEDLEYDLENVYKQATTFTRARPKGRAEGFMTAAKIISDVDEDTQTLGRYITMAAMSYGDLASDNEGHLDTVRQWYIESITAFDKLKDKNKLKDEKRDAGNALVKYIYTLTNNRTLLQKDEVRDIDKHLDREIEEALKAVFESEVDKRHAFELLGYLIIQSSFAQEKILPILYEDATFRNRVITFFSEQFGEKSISSVREFGKLWDRFRKNFWKHYRERESYINILEKFGFSKTETSKQLQNLHKAIDKEWNFEADTEFIQRIVQIIRTSEKLINASSYEIKENEYDTIISNCEKLLSDIKLNPTKLAIEKLHPIVHDTILDKARKSQEELKEDTQPQLIVRMPEDYGSYLPDKDNRIELQVVISNKDGRSPAENINIEIDEENEAEGIRMLTSEFKLPDVVRGGQQRIAKLPILLSSGIIEKQAFSVKLCVTYMTVTKHVQRTDPQLFSIDVSSSVFENIPNPYDVGGIVQSEDMFFGRKTLIDRIATQLNGNRNKKQGDAFLLYGQKRTGKSSIQHYLGEKLKANPDNIVVDIGNIGSNIGEGNMHNKILWGILRKLYFNLKLFLRKRSELPLLQLDFPKDINEFLGAPDPHAWFTEVFEKFKQEKILNPEWEKIRIVLLIDEFTYLYKQIKRGDVSVEIMTNWKAFLQADYFDAILVGQDFAPHFIDEYKNQFAAVKLVKVNYLEEQAAKDLIEQPIFADGKSRYRENAVPRILELTARSPFYIQYFCQKLVDYMNEKRLQRITDATVEDLVSQLTGQGQEKESEKKLDKAIFDNLYNSEDQSNNAVSERDAIRVLSHIARNSETGACSRKMILCETESDIDFILDNLLKRDVIATDQDRENYFYIKVGLFKEWLTSNTIAYNGE